MDGAKSKVEAGGNAVRRTPLLQSACLQCDRVFRLCGRLTADGLAASSAGPVPMRLIHRVARASRGGLDPKTR